MLCDLANALRYSSLVKSVGTARSGVTVLDLSVIRASEGGFRQPDAYTPPMPLPRAGGSSPYGRHLVKADLVKRRHETSYIESLEKRLESLEAAQSPTHAHSEPRRGRSLSSRTPQRRALMGGMQHRPPVESDEPDDSSYLGSSSAVGFMEEAYRSLPAASTASPASTGKPLSSMSSWFVDSGAHSNHDDVPMHDLWLPPRDVADQLLDTYFEYAHSEFPVFLKPIFLQQYVTTTASDHVFGPY